VVYYSRWWIPSPQPVKHTGKLSCTTGSDGSVVVDMTSSLSGVLQAGGSVTVSGSFVGATGELIQAALPASVPVAPSPLKLALTLTLPPASVLPGSACCLFFLLFLFFS
jgi:hypothetical protein